MNERELHQLTQQLFEPGLYLTTKAQTETTQSRLPLLQIPAGYFVHVLFKFNDGYSLCENITTKEIGLIKSDILYKLLLNQIIFMDSVYNKSLKFVEYNQVFSPVFVMIVDAGNPPIATANETPLKLNVVKDSRILDALAEMAFEFILPVQKETSKRIDSGIDMSENPQFFEYLKNLEDGNAIDFDSISLAASEHADKEVEYTDNPFAGIAPIIAPYNFTIATPLEDEVAIEVSMLAIKHVLKRTLNEMNSISIQTEEYDADPEEDWINLSKNVVYANVYCSEVEPASESEFDEEINVGSHLSVVDTSRFGTKTFVLAETVEKSTTKKFVVLGDKPALRDSSTETPQVKESVDYTLERALACSEPPVLDEFTLNMLKPNSESPETEVLDSIEVNSRDLCKTRNKIARQLDLSMLFPKQETGDTPASPVVEQVEQDEYDIELSKLTEQLNSLSTPWKEAEPVETLSQIGVKSEFEVKHGVDAESFEEFSKTLMEQYRAPASLKSMVSTDARSNNILKATKFVEDLLHKKEVPLVESHTVEQHDGHESLSLEDQKYLEESMKLDESVLQRLEIGDAENFDNEQTVVASAGVEMHSSISAPIMEKTTVSVPLAAPVVTQQKDIRLTSTQKVQKNAPSTTSENAVEVPVQCDVKPISVNEQKTVMSVHMEEPIAEAPILTNGVEQRQPLMSVEMKTPSMESKFVPTVKPVTAEKRQPAMSVQKEMIVPAANQSAPAANQAEMETLTLNQYKSPQKIEELKNGFKQSKLAQSLVQAMQSKEESETVLDEFTSNLLKGIHTEQRMIQKEDVTLSEQILRNEIASKAKPYITGTFKSPDNAEIDIEYMENTLEVTSRMLSKSNLVTGGSFIDSYTANVAASRVGSNPSENGAKGCEIEARINFEASQTLDLAGLPSKYLKSHEDAISSITKNNELIEQSIMNAVNQFNYDTTPSVVSHINQWVEMQRTSDGLNVFGNYVDPNVASTAPRSTVEVKVDVDEIDTIDDYHDIFTTFLESRASRFHKPSEYTIQVDSPLKMASEALNEAQMELEQAAAATAALAAESEARINYIMSDQEDTPLTRRIVSALQEPEQKPRTQSTSMYQTLKAFQILGNSFGSILVQVYVLLRRIFGFLFQRETARNKD